METRDGIILLVDDNPGDEALTLRALKKHDIKNEVVIARTGPEALDYLFGTGLYENRDLTVMPEIVLLDLKLPKLDGLEVLYRMRADERTRLLPVVIFTSSNEEHDQVNGYGLGANSYVCKPVDFVEFSEVVRQIVGYWLVANETLPTRATFSWSERAALGAPCARVRGDDVFYDDVFAMPPRQRRIKAVDAQLYLESHPSRNGFRTRGNPAHLGEEMWARQNHVRF